MRKRKLYLSEFILRYADQLEEINIDIFLRNGSKLVHFKNFKECTDRLKPSPYWNYEVYKWDISVNVKIYL